MAHTNPPQGDPTLHAFARLLADAVGADAAGVWMGGHTGQPPARWGGHGFPHAAAALQAHFGQRLWTEPIDLRDAQACPSIDGKAIDQFISVPFQNEEQQDVGLLVCIRYAPAPPDDPVSLERLQALARHVPAPAVQDSLAAPSGIRLRNTLRALEMGDWTYRVATGELILGADAAEILGATDIAPARLDAFLGTLAADSAQSLRHAFDACIRDGQAIDAEVEFTAGPEAAKWVRILGEAALGAGGTPEAIHGVVQDVSARRNAQEETMRLAMRLTTTLASISEAFATLDREGRFTYVNKESERLLGQAGGELLDQPIHEKLLGKNPALLRQEIARALAEDRRVEVEDYYPGLGMWLELRAYPYAEGLAVYLRDVTQRREAQERLTLLRTSIARINDSVVIIQATEAAHGGARIIFVNESFERLTGLSRNDMGGRSPRVLKKSIGAETFRSLMRDAANARGTHLLRRELLLPRPDGGACWMDLDLVAVHDPDGSLVHWVAVGRDVTERKLAEQKIHHLAFFDPLTLLPNRQLLIERLNSVLERVTRSREGGALMFIDLDDFKILNDTRGHPQGDLLLQQVARRLTGCLRKADTVARIGGDEFVVLLQDLGSDPDIAEHKANAVASKLLATLAEPFDLGQHLHHCTTSIGVTCFDAQHGGVDELLKQADVAMYQAKAIGGNTLAFFDPAMQATLNANAALGADLRAALQTCEQFVVHYQPVCDGARRTIGVEALLRWQHPRRGLCSPAEFIPLAEDTGLIVPLGLWVLQQACAQLAAWAHRPETAHLSIAVNVSVGQFRHPEFVEQVVQAITDHGVQPRLLKLELTESLLADRQDITLARMDALKRLGVSFSLDDFGTGYSSLSYLKRLPLDQLKIDKGFVADVLTDPSDAAIARAVIELAHSLRLPVIAEGVETEAQYQFLARCGCDLFQGYLLARPMPPDALEAFLGQQALTSPG